MIFLLILGFANFHSYQFVQGNAEMLGEFSTDTDLQQGDNLLSTLKIVVEYIQFINFLQSSQKPPNQELYISKEIIQLGSDQQHWKSCWSWKQNIHKLNLWLVTLK